MITRMAVRGERTANSLIDRSPMLRLRDTARQSGYCENRIATCVLILIALLAPFLAFGESAPGQSQGPASSATLQGSVRDSHGRPLTAVTVYLKGGDQHSDCAHGLTGDLQLLSAWGGRLFHPGGESRIRRGNFRPMRARNQKTPRP